MQLASYVARGGVSFIDRQKYCSILDLIKAHACTCMPNKIFTSYAREHIATVYIYIAIAS